MPHEARTRSMASSLIVGEPGRAQHARGAFGLLQSVLEQHGAALDRRRRVVELVGEAGRELAERGHLLVAQVVRREVPRAIDHLVHEDRRRLMALANHLGQQVAMQRQDLTRLLRDGVAGRADHPGVREHAGDVAGPPLHDLVPARASVDEDGDVPGQDDVEALRPRRPWWSGLHLRRGDAACRARRATRVPRVARRRGSCAGPAVRQSGVTRHATRVVRPPRGRRHHARGRPIIRREIIALSPVWNCPLHRRTSRQCAQIEREGPHPRACRGSVEGCDVPGPSTQHRTTIAPLRVGPREYGARVEFDVLGTRRATAA